MAKANPRKNKRKGRRPQKAQMLFEAKNYQLMALGVGLVVFGYAIMSFENEVDGFISLYIAPLLILGGYLEIIYAILYHKDESPSGADK